MASLLYPDEEQFQAPLSLLQPPDDRPPVLQPDSRADALGQVYQQVMDAVEEQRRISAERGLWDDNTGLPTKAGLLDAIGQVGTAVALGTGGAPERPSITAYHGSPHRFDAFDLSKIGTGEGAQAYGHGMYLAENEGVARGYRDALAPGSRLAVNGVPVTELSDAERVVASWMERTGKSPEELIPITQQRIAKAHDDAKSLGLDPAGFVEEHQAMIDAAQKLKDAQVGRIPPGHMYEVNVHADPERFLHWDKPLSEQHPDVIKALNNTPYPPRDMRMSVKDYMAELETNREMASKTGDPAALASQALQQAGIPGIRYLDQGSRGAGEGSHNYVVFDANTMNIIRRYGLAGLMAGAGGAATGYQQQ